MPIDSTFPPRNAPARKYRGALPALSTSVLASHPPTGAEFSFLEFDAYFPHVPTALAIKECVRLKRVKELPVVGPVLDVGCGDGLFTSLAWPGVDTWGVDVNEREAARAQASHAYERVIDQSITDTSALPESFFATCVANCSLEHVPDIRAALHTIRRSMRPLGIFYLIVPNGEWTRTLPLRRGLERVGLPDVGRAYAAALDAQFAHHHLYDADVWRGLLEDAGFTGVESERLGSDGSQAAFEAWLVPSLAGYVTKKLTGHWIVASRLRRFYSWPVFRAVKQLVQANREGAGAELLIVARVPAGETTP
jgi:SAM-dependent methyltransferase